MDSYAMLTIPRRSRFAYSEQLQSIGVELHWIGNEMESETMKFAQQYFSYSFRRIFASNFVIMRLNRFLVRISCDNVLRSVGQDEKSTNKTVDSFIFLPHSDPYQWQKGDKLKNYDKCFVYSKICEHHWPPYLLNASQPTLICSQMLIFTLSFSAHINHFESHSLWLLLIADHWSLARYHLI